jgi:putative SOS response-associated peptidase YedK
MLARRAWPRSRCFRDAFKDSRCLVPISSYYEWVSAPDGKQPFYFTRTDGAPITVAGLRDDPTAPMWDREADGCASVKASGRTPFSTVLPGHRVTHYPVRSQRKQGTATVRMR